MTSAIIGLVAGILGIVTAIISVVVAIRRSAAAEARQQARIDEVVRTYASKLDLERALHPLLARGEQQTQCAEHKRFLLSEVEAVESRLNAAVGDLASRVHAIRSGSSSTAQFRRITETKDAITADLGKVYERITSEAKQANEALHLVRSHIEDKLNASAQQVSVLIAGTKQLVEDRQKMANEVMSLLIAAKSDESNIADLKATCGELERRLRKLEVALARRRASSEDSGD